ncbi:class I SAM-dependent methyltransferase [Desulfonatronum thioautotrophicum]|uniref:class I SAM-dependent methyltransferase n=1 Tax=Desulfonatronum thioautotrophicum TaxID=617001 RepID=UPI0005EADFFE|nr:class I SAM-dependent methyltransferase [Desulfonatronum thioautotrophicum]
MRNDAYAHSPHVYHAQTFPLDPSPFLAPLTRHVPAPAHVLDVGCGSGRDLLWMKQRGYNLLGLERSPGLAKLARTHAGCEVLCADFDSFDFTTLSVDAVILIGALVHVPKDRFPATLARILQALMPGGHVLLTMKQGGGVSTAGDGRVFVLWRDEELREVFSGMGLAVVEAFTNTSVLGTGEVWLGYVTVG